MHSGPEMVTKKTCIKMAKLENYPHLANTLSLAKLPT